MLFHSRTVVARKAARASQRSASKPRTAFELTRFPASYHNLNKPFVSSADESLATETCSMQASRLRSYSVRCAVPTLADSKRYRVARLTPRISAARVLSPPS